MGSKNSPGTTEHEEVDCSCKVGRVLREYDLEGLDARLRSAWNGEDGEKRSLRDLEEYFNREVLRAGLERAGNTVIDGEVENYYRLLTGEGPTSGSEVAAKRRLERQGVDPAAVTADFVSHQTIHKHLRDCLGESHEPASDPETRLQNARQFVEATRARTQSVSEGTIRQLRDAGVLDIEEFDVYADLSVNCNACGRAMSAADLLDRGGCDCQDTG